MRCPECDVELPPDARYCANCGQPIPGARGPSAGSPSNKLIVVLVIAVGGLFVVVVLGIILAIAVPNFLNAVDRGKQKRTMADMRSIGTALEAYAVDHGAYPVADDLAQVEGLLEPVYIQAMPTRDGWEHRFDAASSASQYHVVSPGKDGVFQGCRGGPTNTFAADICFANGQFTQWPEGLQY
jgi:general secretion pathway protein G